MSDDGFVVVHSPVIDVNHVHSLPTLVPSVEDTETRAESPKSELLEFVVPIDVNAFIQDIERSFKRTAKAATTDRTVWQAVWSQFTKDLPRERLEINGTIYRDPEAVERVLKGLVREEDYRLIIMLAQQCVMALPYEILSRCHCDPDSGVYLGEISSSSSSGSQANGGNGGTDGSGWLARVRATASSMSVTPERLRIRVTVSGTQHAVSIRKLFRLFSADSGGTLATVDLALDLDLLHDDNVLAVWKFQPQRPPHPAPAPAAALAREN